MKESGKKLNHMTVPVAIKELEKIKMMRQSDADYRLAYAVTATQKEILKAFNMTTTNIREQAIGINEELKRCEGESKGGKNEHRREDRSAKRSCVEDKRKV